MSEPKTFARGIDLNRPVVRAPITIVGLGGIGSWVAECLMRMGAERVHVIDPDVIEEVNCGPQCYTRADLGLAKVDATIARAAGLGLQWTGERMAVGSGTDLAAPGEGRIVVSGVDSMRARADIWRAVRGAGEGVTHYLDGRVSRDSWEVHSVRTAIRADCERYRHSLYSSREVPPEPCTARMTAFVGLAIGGYTANAVRNVCQGKSPMSKWEWDGECLAGIEGVRHE